MTHYEASVERAIRAGCEATVPDEPRPLLCGADCPCNIATAVRAALRTFIEHPDLGISHECRETLRAHLGERSL